MLALRLPPEIEDRLIILAENETPRQKGERKYIRLP